MNTVDTQGNVVCLDLCNFPAYASLPFSLVLPSVSLQGCGNQITCSLLAWAEFLN